MKNIVDRVTGFLASFTGNKESSDLPIVDPSANRDSSQLEEVVVDESKPDDFGIDMTGEVGAAELDDAEVDSAKIRSDVVINVDNSGEARISENDNDDTNEPSQHEYNK